MKKFDAPREPISFTGTAEETEQFWGRVNASLDVRAKNMNCIGSACMMWRWDVMLTERNAERWQDVYGRSKTSGHCGLAGTP